MKEPGKVIVPNLQKGLLEGWNDCYDLLSRQIQKNSLLRLKALREQLCVGDKEWYLFSLLVVSRYQS
jgi:hypothetical protein